MTERSIALQEYGFLKDLSSCFMRPSLTLAEAIRSGKLAEGFAIQLDAPQDSPLGQAISQLTSFSLEVKETSLDEIRLLLEVEYNRLFVGPDKVPCPPYESYYRTDVPEIRLRTLKGPAEQQVKEFYRTFGLIMAEDYYELADHIFVELDFLSYLNLMEARAWKNDDQDEITRIRQGYDIFLRNHLQKWFAPFAEDVTKHARLSFYPALVTIIGHTILADA